MRCYRFWQSKLAAILASFIIHKPRQRSAFTKAALKTVHSLLPEYFIFLFPFTSITGIGSLEISIKNWYVGKVFFFVLSFWWKGSIWTFMYSLLLTLLLLVYQLESIEALEQFMLKHRKDYVDLHRTTEQERDSIEHEVSYQTYPQKPLAKTF